MNVVEYKNQHYVPQFYMRGWTNNDRLPSFHIERQVEYPPTKVGNLCSSDYFYSQHTSIEEALSDLEASQAPAIEALRKGNSLRFIDNYKRKMILSFLTTQRMRTALFRDEIHESGEDIFREALESDFGEAEIHPDEKAEIYDEIISGKILATHHFLMMHGILGYITIGDLDSVLLINQTKRDLVFSDAPVIFDNWYFKKQQNLRYAGIANRGLQIYCPIGPRRLLALYDPISYSATREPGWSATIDSERTVYEFNQLQALNSNQSIFYRKEGQEGEMKDLVNSAMKYKRSEPIVRDLETKEGEEFEMSYVPKYQLYPFTPSVNCLNKRLGVRYESNRRPIVDELQQYIVGKILSKSSYTEKAVEKAVEFLLKSDVPQSTS